MGAWPHSRGNHWIQIQAASKTRPQQRKTLGTPVQSKQSKSSGFWTRVDSMVAFQPFYSPNRGPATPVTMNPLSAVLAPLAHPRLHI